MSKSGLVHWHEGLFLQPHHLQSMQRGLMEELASARKLSWAYPVGVVEARLSADALENMLVRFDRLRAVMPSGVEVDFPETTDVPPLDIRKRFEASSEPFVVELGVPLWYATRGNAIERNGSAGGAGGQDWREKRIFRVDEITRPDENSGANPQAVLIRRVNARLLLPEDDHTDIETIPLLRIGQGTGEDVGMPRQDPAFIPPCMTLGGSPALKEMLRDLTNQVEASRKELVIQMTRGGFAVDMMRGVQFEQMLRLRTLNRFAGSLPTITGAPNMPPYIVYCQLRELLGELAALQPDRDPFDAPAYDHMNQGPAFRDLVRSIRALLKGAVTAKFMKLPFTKEGEIMTARLADEHLTGASEYFLGVKSKEDPRAVAKLVENASEFKLMAKSMIMRNIFGIKLAEERHPPLELPSMAGLSYFRLMRADSERMWAKITEERDLGLRWLGVENSDYEVTLFMTAHG